MTGEMMMGSAFGFCVIVAALAVAFQFSGAFGSWAMFWHGAALSIALGVCTIAFIGAMATATVWLS